MKSSQSSSVLSFHSFVNRYLENMAQPEISTIRYEIVLRDLESLLKKQLGHDLILINFDNEPLVAAGENYGSTITKVTARIKKSNNAEDEEKLHLVAKMLPDNEMFRAIFECYVCFKKEVFLYEKLVPIYKEIYDNNYDPVPKYYGSRYSLNDEAQELDDDALLLIENLNVKGYYMQNRIKGMDLEHIKATIPVMAKFHAVGLSLKYKKPSYLNELRQNIKPSGMKAQFVRRYLEDDFEVIKNDSEMSQYYDKIKSFDTMEHITGKPMRIILDPEDPWACIVHRDFWTNNLLFHRGENGQIDDIKIIDFQSYCFSSPVTDLVSFLCITKQLPLSKHFDAMIELYRQVVYDMLEKLECDPTMFTKEIFEKRLKIDALGELYHILVMCKITEAREDEDVVISPLNEHCINRLRQVVQLYVDKEWI